MDSRGCPPVRLNGQIDTKNQEIEVLEAKKQEIDGNWRLGNHADGSRNEAYFQDKEQARRAVIDAKAEKLDLVTEKKELKEDYEAFEKGDISRVSLSFPEQFYYVMNQARWSDNILNLCFFTITALMGSGAVLIKTFVFETDSYSKKLQSLEDKASNEEQLKSAMNTSAQQIYYSLFNTDVMEERLKTKLQRLQDDFELEIETLARKLYDARAKQIGQKIREQAVSESINWDENELISTDVITVEQKDKFQFDQNEPESKSNKSSSRNQQYSSDDNVISAYSDPWLSKSQPDRNHKIENEENNISQVGKYDDYMTLFNEAELNNDHKRN